MTDDFQNFDEQAADEAPAPAFEEAANGAIHGEVPGDVLNEAPREDGLNLMGYYRRAAGDDDQTPEGFSMPPGSTVVVKLEASDTARAGYEGKGFIFCGYAPA